MLTLKSPGIIIINIDTATDITGIIQIITILTEMRTAILLIITGTETAAEEEVWFQRKSKIRGKIDYENGMEKCGRI